MQHPSRCVWAQILPCRLKCSGRGDLQSQRCGQLKVWKTYKLWNGNFVNDLYTPISSQLWGNNLCFNEETKATVNCLQKILFTEQYFLRRTNARCSQAVNVVTFLFLPLHEVGEVFCEVVAEDRLEILALSFVFLCWERRSKITDHYAVPGCFTSWEWTGTGVVSLTSTVVILAPLQSCLLHRQHLHSPV